MSEPTTYCYTFMRAALFTEQGMRTVLQVASGIRKATRMVGPCTRAQAVHASDATGDSWLMMAAIDYLIEVGHVRNVGGTLSYLELA